MGIDVVQTIFLHFQATIFMSEPLEQIIRLKVYDFCRNNKVVKIQQKKKLKQNEHWLSDSFQILKNKYGTKI